MMRVSVSLLIVALCLVTGRVSQGTTQASISTDQKIYFVGQPITINGTGFTANSVVNVTVENPDHSISPLSGANTDASGNFSVQYAAPAESGRYKITATDGANSATTAATEADAVSIDFRQCAQNDSANGQPLGLGYCNWINSNIQANNSQLFEGIATEQQMIMQSLPTGSHTLVIGIEATKAGLHTYDFLVSDAVHQSTTNTASDASPDSTANSEKASAEAGITLQLNRCGPQVGTSGTPSMEATCSALTIGAVMSPGTNFNSIDIPVPDDPFVSATFDASTSCGNGSTQCRIDAYEQLYGNRTCRLYTDGPISGTPTMTLAHSGNKTSFVAISNGQDTGDSYIFYTITWNSPTGTNAMFNCAADISRGDSSTLGTNWGNGLGAGGVSGSPYHYFLVSLDGVGGSVDNQMAAAAIFTPPSTVLSFVSQSPSGAGGAVEAGSSVTITVNEQNTGGSTITGVSVTGSPCATWSGGATTLAPSASANFTCTFTATAGLNSWNAQGNGSANGVTVPLTNETQSGSFPGLSPSTSLTLVTQVPSGNVEAGTSVTITVNEANTGNTTLTSVSVTGTPCATWSGGAATLAPSGSAGSSANFTCTFTASAGTNSWNASGHGTDPLGTVVPTGSGTPEFASGSFFGNQPSTALTFVSQVPSGSVEAGTSVTITVNEANTGNATLTSVSVTGTPCATWSGGAATLAPSGAAGSSANFTCTFTASAGTNSWNASGHGTDPLGTVVPTGSGTPEFASGSFFGDHPATALTFVSQVPSGNVEAGTSVTITVNEANTGNVTLTSVSVTGTPCATWSGGAATLAPSGAAGSSANFTCTFTASAGANAWNASGHGTDPLGTVVPTGSGTPEYASGSVSGNAPGTALTFVSQVPSGNVEAGTSVTITVNEANTGNVTLTSVSVTGTPCATWSGGAATLAPSGAAGSSANFTCTFTASAGTNSWNASGHGTDPLGTVVPTGSGTPEFASGSFFGNQPSTALTFVSQVPSGTVEAGTSVTITVNEANTGNATLTSVSVTGTPCATWSGGAATLAPSGAAGSSANFTCTFTASAGTNSWNASGHGTDPLGTVVPTGSGTPEFASGSFFGNQPSTALTFVSQVPSGTVEAGTSVTITVNEANTGNATLTSVSVTGTPCATWSGGAASLAPSGSAGSSANFTCTFTASAGTNSWNASGHGTDSLGHVVPTGSGTPEFASGSFFGNSPSTALTFVSQVPSNPIEVGTSVTITVREQNTGNVTLTSVSVSGSPCSSWSGGATTLAPSASANFTCTFTAGLGTNSWSADGHGTDTVGHVVPTGSGTPEHASGSFTGYQANVVVNKVSSNGTGTFNFTPTGFSFPGGVNNLTTVAGALGTTAPSGGATTGLIPVIPGTYSVGETGLPSNFVLDLSSCTLTDYLGGVTNSYGTSTANIGGVDSAWSFTVPIGGTVTCTFNNALVALTTRTQGFWATHTLLADTVWSGGTIPSGPITNPVVGSPDESLCGFKITALASPEENILMGGFWSSISNLSGKGGKRSSLDQSRMQMVQQYLAAVLNVHLFGSSPTSFGVSLAQARTDYCSGNASAIQADIGFLGNFNQSGDAGLFDPGMSATAQTSKTQADIDAWDIPQFPGLSDEDSGTNPLLATTKNVTGAALATDYTLKATCSAAPCTVSNTATASGAGGFASTSIPKGVYRLSETSTENGFTVSVPWACTGTGNFFLTPGANGGTATLAIGYGANVSCSLTNNK